MLDNIKKLHFEKNDPVVSGLSISIQDFNTELDTFTRTYTWHSVRITYFFVELVLLLHYSMNKAKPLFEISHLSYI